jgi:outer membrane protein
MRSFLTVALAVVGVAVSAASAAAQQPSTRIAYVNPQALFMNAPGREQAEATFQKETEGMRSELTRLGEALNRMVSEYQRAEAGLTAAQKEQRQRVLAAKEDSLRLRQQELEEQAGRRQGELMAPIMELVRKVLEDIRVEDGYAMILSAEPGQSPILVADKNLDITDRVVSRLKTTRAPAAAQQRPPGAPTTAPAGVTRPRPPAE